MDRTSQLNSRLDDLQLKLAELKDARKYANGSREAAALRDEIRVVEKDIISVLNELNSIQEEQHLVF